MSIAARISGLLAGATALAFAASPAAADDYPNAMAEREDATVLAPVTPWNIDFGASRCRLTRVFGTEEDQHLLFFEQAAPDSAFGFTVAGQEVRRYQNVRRLRIGMERDEPLEMLDRVGIGDVEGFGPAIIVASYDIGPEPEENAPRSVGIDLDEAATIDRIVLRRGSNVLSFETGNMMPAFQAMNVCTNDLLRDWGLDPEQHVNYTPPVWSNAQTITRRLVSQYPREALIRGEQAVFRFHVILEEDGSVSSCFVENSTETDRLESPVCNEMQDAEFAPALDASGQPMRSYYSSTISYVMN